MPRDSDDLLSTVDTVPAGAPPGSPYASVAQFSYTDLEPEAAAIARSAAADIKAARTRSVRDIGHCLTLVKEALPHGEFTRWAEAELGITGRSARNYMAAAMWLEGKPATVSVLPPALIYTLASSSTPVELVDDVIAMGEAGEIDHGVVRQKLDTFKSEQTELRHAQRRSPKLTVAGLRAQKLKHREQARREHERLEQKQELDRSKRRIRLKSLAERVASLGQETGEELLAALADYKDHDVLILLLGEFVAARERPG